MNWDDLNWTKSYSPMMAYSQSKLANILFTRELAKRLEGTQVTVNALHPGVVRTELARYFGETYGTLKTMALYLFFPILIWLMKSVKAGAQTTINCAVSSELKNVSGFYFSDCKVKQLLPHALDQQDQKKLWEVSETMCQLNNN